MTVSEFAANVASIVGNDAMQGAIILVAIDRTVDRLIQKSLALSCHHPGKPSPWSHTFLLAAPFQGASTPILDCTVRDSKGNIDLHPKLFDILKTIVDKNGGVFGGELGLYDIDQVHPVGVKLISDAAPAERASIISGDSVPPH